LICTTLEAISKTSLPGQLITFTKPGDDAHFTNTLFGHLQVFGYDAMATPLALSELTFFDACPVPETTAYPIRLLRRSPQASGQ
jgi:hypothetical protein